MNVFFSFLFTSPLWRGGRDLLWGPFHVTSPALTDDVWTLGAVNGCGIHRRRQVFFFFFAGFFLLPALPCSSSNAFAAIGRSERTFLRRFPSEFGETRLWFLMVSSPSGFLFHGIKFLQTEVLTSFFF